MRWCLLFPSSVSLTLAVNAGCGKKESGGQAGKVPSEVKKAETMDTTGMDSAAAESTAVDTAGSPADSM